MSQRTFTIEAIWDEQEEVFFSRSDIIGLHIEAPTITEFEDVARDLALELILANHTTPEMLSSLPMKDLVPAIFWKNTAPPLST